MKLARLIVLGVISLGTGLPVVAQDSAPASQPAAQVQPQEQATSPLDKIRSAAQPSDAVAAYGSAVAAMGDAITVEQTYVRRMMDFGLPEMAESQAMDLTRRAPGDGLPWAVAAYMSARRGQIDPALIQTDVAVKELPDEPFVLRTAGQLLAWYDTRADRAKVSEAANQSADSIRKLLSDRPTFADAYRKTQDEYAQSAATSQPTTAPSQRYSYDSYSAPVYTYAVPGPSIYSPYSTYYVGPPVYTDPFFYGYGYSYGPWWPNTYLGLWWGPPFPHLRDDDHGHFVDRGPDRNDMDRRDWPSRDVGPGAGGPNPRNSSPNPPTPRSRTSSPPSSGRPLRSR